MNIHDTFSKYSNFFTLLIVFIFIDIVAPLLLNLLNVDVSYFIVYLLWANVLLLTYIFLPSNVGDLFL